MSSEKEASTRHVEKLAETLALMRSVLEATEAEAEAAVEAIYDRYKAARGPSAPLVSIEEELTEKAHDEAVLDGGLRYLDAINERLDALNTDLETHLCKMRAAPTSTSEMDSRTAAGT